MTKSLIIRALFIYFITSFFRRPQASPQSQVPNSPEGKQLAAFNYFENGTLFDLHVYLSERSTGVDWSDGDSLIWLEGGLTYGDWYAGPTNDGIFTKSVKFKPSKQLQNNGSIFLYTFVTMAGKSPNPNTGEDFAGKSAGFAGKMMNKYKKIRYQKTVNLLTGGTERSEEEQKKAETISSEVVSHWHPNITLNLIFDQTPWTRGKVPPPLDEYVKFMPGGATYLPILYLNDYWNMQRDYMPINDTVQELELHLTFQPLSLFKWQLYAAHSMKNQWGSMFGEVLAQEDDDGDQDSLKTALLDTNPYLLGLTIAISILHSIFELLAFKNDIQFWKDRKSLEGLSVRSVFFNVFQSLIVLLYVLDNETNFMIKISCFVGLLIELWKIKKVVNITFDPEQKWFGVIPRITFTDKGSYVESSTRQYDQMAFKYLGWMCFPLLIGYTVYALIYLEHKGWYSFVLNMLYGFLLTFGFIMMTPQLFINYKLKSVAHLPWRMMTYKFLNTFIDDIFAFVIKMPTMYRIGCFRDDIVFFIFLYQRWIYKVDSKRVNEFGFSAEMLDKKEGDQPAIEEAPKPEAEKKDD